MKKPGEVAWFGPATFAFLRGLAANQAKPWFEANRAAYERELLGPCRLLAEMVAAELAAREVPLTGDAKRSIFRIHRDVRFSKDKKPYKDHGSLVWMRAGAAKMSPGVLYLHIADEGSFMAAGFYGLERPAADAIRSAVRDDPAAYQAAMARAVGNGLALDTADSMVRMPRGFEMVSDPALVPAIKTRNVVVMRPLGNALLGSAGLVGTLVEGAEAALPLLRFGWDAIADRGPDPEWAKLH